MSVGVEGGTIDVACAGRGPLVVLVPSAGREAADFDDLADRARSAGYTTLQPQPRGIAPTTAPLDGLSMQTLADDVAAVVRAVGSGATTAFVVGHAFGNRVARMTATVHPDVVAGVVLLACGGAVAPAPEATAALRAVFDASLTPDDHLDAVRSAFFASGNDAVVWTGGWHADVASAQGRATSAIDAAEWWTAGQVPVLVVQPAEDVIAVAANAADIVARLGDRARLVTIPGAGHALLPEQPDAVADAVLSWLDERAG